MKFRRDEFYGLNFDWYAVDADGCVAQLTAGYSPIPYQVFANEQTYNVVWDYFRTAAAATSSRLSSLTAARVAARMGDYSLHLMEARRGLYIYGEESPQGSSWYELEALPDEPVHISGLPESVRAFLLQFRLLNLRFPDCPRLNVEHFFTCL